MANFNNNLPLKDANFPINPQLLQILLASNQPNKSGNINFPNISNVNFLSGPSSVPSNNNPGFGYSPSSGEKVQDDFRTGSRTPNNRQDSGFLYGYNTGDLNEYLYRQLLGWQADKGWNDDLTLNAYNNHLNRLLTLDQRSYDSPQATLQRLMDAGVSREYALQMLNGSGSSGGGSAQTAENSFKPSEQNLNDEQAALVRQNQISSPINTCFAGIEAIASLISAIESGVSINTARAGANIAKNDSALSDYSRNASETMGALNQALSLAGTSIGTFKSAKDLNDYMRSADAPASIKSFTDSGQWDALQRNPYGVQAIAHNMNLQLEPEQKHEEMNQMRSQVALMNIQADLENAKINLVDAQTLSQQILNQWDALKFDDYKITRDVINATNLYEWNKKMRLACAANDPKIVQAEIETLMSDATNRKIASAILALGNSDFYDKVQNDPATAKLFYQANILKQCGYDVQSPWNNVNGMVMGAGAGVYEGILDVYNNTINGIKNAKDFLIQKFKLTDGNYYHRNYITTPYPVVNGLLSPSSPTAPMP